MKINNWYRGEAMSLILPVSTFGSRSVAGFGIAGQARVINACLNRDRVHGTGVSAAGELSSLRHASSRTITAVLPRTGKPSGIVQRDGMEAPRGNPPRSRPKWA